MKDVVIFDPWHWPELSDWYIQLARRIKELEVNKIVVACYESNIVDPVFWEHIKDDERVVRDGFEYSIDQLANEVIVAGHSWQKCIHARPLGIPFLLYNKKNVWSQPLFCMGMDENAPKVEKFYNIEDNHFEEDWFVWKQQDEWWLCEADEKNVLDATSMLTAKNWI